MAQFAININGGSAPYVVSVKKTGDNTERWISGGTTGSGIVTFTGDNVLADYVVTLSKNGCTTATALFSMNCGTPVPTVPTPVPTVSCDIVITNINVVCNSDTTSTVTVIANSPSGRTLRYGILGFVNYQTSNVFQLGNSDSNGYTFIVAELGNETVCNATSNRVINCTVPTTPVPTVPSPSPVAPSPVNTCNLSISSVSVSCVGNNNGTVVVNVSNPSNYTLEYKIENLTGYQQSNTFTGITNGTSYTVKVRNVNNISCEATSTNVIVDCQSVPTPITPTPVTPTPVSCNLSITGTSTSCNGANDGVITVNVSNPNSYTLQYQLDGFYTWQSSNVFSGVTNGSNYTVRVRNANNTSCESVANNVAIECNSVPSPVTPTPISPTPSPISPVPSPISPTPTPVTPTPTGCPDIVLTNNNVYTTTSSYYTFEVNIAGGVAPYTFQTLPNGGNVDPNIFLDPIDNAGNNTIKLSPNPLIDNDGGVVATTYDFGYRVIDANGCVSNVIYLSRPIICRRYTVTNIGTGDLLLNVYNCSNVFVEQLTIAQGATTAQFNAARFNKSGSNGTIQFTDLGYI